MKPQMQRPTQTFLTASWIALFIGITAYLIGLWNSAMQLNEKGYYFALIMYGLFAAVSLQKSVRDRLEGIPVTGVYFTACSLSLIIAILLLFFGLWNAELTSSEKGFYAMSFVLSLFATVTVQKNIRDVALFNAAENDS
ncbi:MAG: YiaA/YiaB family protein [Methylococcaceae bacterium]|nr:YiaA/YiaB family protein [Methylococcaceae bacterium]